MGMNMVVARGGSADSAQGVYKTAFAQGDRGHPQILTNF